MIGLLVIAHAPLADALLQCARHVYGSDPGHCSRSIAFDILPTADPAQSAEQARQLCADLDCGQGVLVLTDLFGATPANIAAQLARPGRVEVLTGASVPMVLRALSYRGSLSLAQLVEKAMVGATAGVIKIASTAPQNQQLSVPDSHHDANARLPHHQ